MAAVVVVIFMVVVVVVGWWPLSSFTIVIISVCHWLVAWRVSACVKLEIKIVRTHLCGMTHTSCRAYTMSPMVDSM